MPATEKSIVHLREKMVSAARGFHDYNFRQYFVNRVNRNFAEVEKWPADRQREFLSVDGPKQLHQMQRMAVVNRMYSHQPVFFDHKADDSSSPLKE